METLTIKLKDKKAFKIFETLEAMNVISVVSVVRNTKKIELEKQKHRRKIIQAFKEVELIQSGKLKGIPLKELIAELNEI